MNYNKINILMNIRIAGVLLVAFALMAVADSVSKAFACCKAVQLF